MPRPVLPVPWFTRTALLVRSRQVMGVLTRHGLDWLLTQLEGEVSSRHLTEGTGRSEARARQAINLRRALEELGPTFIKLGQALSTRPDLLPQAYVDELLKLVDDLPPAPFEEEKKLIEQELGRSLEEAFGQFNTIPIASASIGQVYAAELKNGQRVVVKVHRPGVEKSIQQDLEILSDMAEWAVKHTTIGRMYDLLSLLDEFSFRLRNELDYLREGHNADIIRRQFYGDPCVYVPRVYWDLTTSRVITIERVSGLKITDIEGMDRAGINRRVVAENSARFTLRQLFEFGFFHADPHPGNFYVQADGSLAVMDFGMVGRFSDQLKTALIRLALSTARGDADAVVDVMLDMGMTSHRIRRHALEQDISRLIESYAEGNYQLMSTTQIFNQIMGMAFRYGLQLPSEMTMLGRLVTINEGISMRLYPPFRMLDFAVPYVTSFWKEERSPRKILPRLGEATLEGLELTLDLPRQASRLLKQLERGQMEFNINYDGLRDIMSQMQKMTNRLALAMLLSAIIVALGLVLVIYHPATWQQVGEFVFGFAFISSLAVGGWLMFSIFRSGRT